MSRTRKLLLTTGSVVLTLFILFGCSLLFRDGSEQSGWHIKLNINPQAAAKAINVNEHDVTGLAIEVYDPFGVLIEEISWLEEEDQQSYLIPVKDQGEHEIVVTHISDENGVTVEAEESALFNIQAMVITVIDIIPGCIGTIKVEPGGEEPLIDLTGYWDLYMTIDGGPEMGPDIFYILQTGQSLDCSIGISGSISGTNITLKMSMDGYNIVFVGTLSGDEIYLSFTDSPFGSGTLRLTRSTMSFGRFDLEGICEGVPVSLHTDYAVASGGVTETWYELGFDLNTGIFYGSLAIYGGNLSVGYFAAEEMEVMLWDGSTSHTAWGGYLEITELTDTGMAGSFDLNFNEGHLFGAFDLIFDTNNGQTTVEGTWKGNSVSAALPNAFSSLNVQMNDPFYITYVDHDLQVYLFGSVPGDMVLGVPFEWGIGLVWRSDAGAGFDDVNAETGTLTITRYDEDGISGDFTANFHGGGSVTGSFDVSFEVWGFDV